MPATDTSCSDAAAAVRPYIQGKDGPVRLKKWCAENCVMHGVRYGMATAEYRGLLLIDNSTGCPH